MLGAAILALLVALVYQKLANKQDLLSLLKQGEPAASKFESIGGEYPGYKLFDEDGHFLDYAVIASASGYGGKLTALSIIDAKGVIKKVVLLDQAETPVYYQKALAGGILDKFAGQNIGSGIPEVDAVTGATVTSKAILSAVDKGIIQIGNDQLNLNLSSRNRIALDWPDILAVGLVVLAAFASAFNLRKLRPWLLISSVILIGFILNDTLSLGNFVSLLTGNLPVFIERPVWFVFVPGIFLVTLVWQRNFYCGWLCPFGAAQEGIFRSLNLIHFSTSKEIQSRIRRFRWPTLWLVALVAIVLNRPGIAGYEPFSAFFDSSGTPAQWGILVIVIVMSMAQLRYWCNSFCPVGATLDFTAHLLPMVKKQIRIHPPAIPVDSVAVSQPNCAECPAKQAALSKQDRFYTFVSISVLVLIFVNLLENMHII